MPRRKLAPDKLAKANIAFKALEVIALMRADGKLDDSKACIQIGGITVNDFRAWVVNHQDSLMQIQELVKQEEINQMLRLALVGSQIMDKVITDGLAAATFPLDRLAILQYVEGRVGVLQERYQPQPITNSDLLVGPQTEEMSSRFVGVDSQVETDGSVTVRITPGKIIELPPEKKEGGN
jgi:hypothetical protein